MFSSQIDWLVRTSWRVRAMALLIAAYVALVIWVIVTGHVGLLITLTVVAIPGCLLARRMYRVHKIRSVLIEAVREKTRWPRRLAATLQPDETVEYETRMHPIMMVHDKRVARFAIVLVAAVVASFFLGMAFLLLAAAALVGMTIYITPRAIEWWFTRRCYTDRRVIVITGVLTKRVAYVMFVHIEAVSHAETWIGSVLEQVGLPGTWHWSFDTQVQNDPFNDLPYSYHPSRAGEILERDILRRRRVAADDHWDWDDPSM